MAVTRARCDPQTRDYIARKKAEGKTNRDAIRCLKRHLARRVWQLLRGREGSKARGPRLERQSPAEQRRSSGGWRRTRPQTEPAESEERDPPTGPARHQLRARGDGASSQ